jgi:hypothetical protein
VGKIVNGKSKEGQKDSPTRDLIRQIQVLDTYSIPPLLVLEKK